MADGFIAAAAATALIPIITLLLGLIIGYLAQRSGFCSIGGMRDLMMFKHTRLFFGYLALIAGGFIGYLIFWAIIPLAFPGFYWTATASNPFQPIPGAPGGLTISSYIILAIIGGLGMGLFGVLLGGCPLRQIIMSTEGNLKSVFFIIGLIIGSIIFHAFTIELVFAVLP
ncbi:MAG: YeeE/YedE thiosulfate transporter family protein [Candidatus Odinarchaeota archaeon]